MGLMTGQHPNIPYPTGSMPAETLVAQPAGSPVCSLGFDGRLLPPSYPHRLSMADLYGAAYPDSTAAAAAAAGYMAGLTPGHPAAMLYPTALAASPYDLKDPRTAWAALPQATGYPCDSTLAMYSAYGDRFDPVDSEARRRNATRETTSTLKAWLNEHRKNPYPTKGEKIMLAIITKMTLTQVSTWFANARRRLKKENKMTWEPRNKTADDLDDVSIDDDEDDKKDVDDDQSEERKSDNTTESVERVKRNAETLSSSTDALEQRLKSNDKDSEQLTIPERLTSPSENPNKKPRTEISSSSDKPSENSPTPGKPKIWSLAQTATSASPPSIRRNIGGTLAPSTSDLEDRLRMNRLLYHDRLLQSDLSSVAFNQRHRDLAGELRSRVLQDSSSESSMSSPPLWRTGEPIVPFDSSDLRTLSSAGSPVVCSSFDGHPNITSSHSYSPARFLGCRLIPGQESMSRQELASHSAIPMIHGDRYHSQPSSLDLRTIHSTFMRPSTFGCPVSFSSSPTSQIMTDIRR